MNRKQLAVATMVAVTAFAGGVVAGKGATLKTVSAEDAKYFPIDPKYPDGANISVINGDPQKGAHSILLKMKAGGSAPIHAHGGDYQAVVISGTPKHWVDGKEADAKPLKAGSWWQQPAKEMHGDACVGTEDCVVYIDMTKKFDFQPKPEAKTDAKAAPTK